MTARDFIGSLLAVAAVAALTVPAGHALAAVTVALADAVAPYGDVSPVHHADRNAR